MAQSSRASLADLSQQCVDHVSEQVDRAHALLSAKLAKGAFRLVLIGAIEDLQKHKASLSQWNATVSTVREIRDPRSYNRTAQAATQLFSLIQSYIAKIENTLERANTISDNGTLVLIDSLGDALDHLDNNINTLNGLSSTLTQSALSLDIARVSHQYEDQKTYFISKIRAIPPDTRRGSFSYQTREFKIKFGDLEWFWWSLPKVDRIENRRRSELRVVYPDPGDGVIISEEVVERATAVLRRFRDAWIDVKEGDPQVDRDKIEKLEKMPKIAMILRAMGPEKWGLFNKFIEEDIDDKDMDNYPKHYAIKALSGGDEAHYMASQYSRVRERDWPIGETLQLEEDEPLPLKQVQSYKSSQNAAVDRVEYLWPPYTEYARKKMTSLGTSQEQINNEIKNLKALSSEDHGHHFVEYVKTYSRGLEFGFLLSPVANEDLSDFLRWCCINPTGRQNYRPALLRSLGCLSYSLCYLHNVKGIRHRDVKPQNVLCLRREGQQEEFMWGDFGHAYGFSEQGFSGTVDEEFRATLQYEAPEIGKPGSGHGRSADVFSFGCLFFEVVSVLALDDGKSVPKIPAREFWNYKDNIPRLEEWAGETSRELRKRKDKTLRKVLQLALEMIKEDPKSRRKIGDITLSLAELGNEGKKTPHPFCDRCVRKRQIDRSRDPKHKEIFVHRKKYWSTA